jgi:chaperonin GroES
MIKPIQDKLLIKPIVSTQTMVNGLYLPDTVTEGPLTGKIIALGTDEEMLAVLSVGDVIIYSTYAGTEMEYEGEKYLMISYSDVLGIVE